MSSKTVALEQISVSNSRKYFTVALAFLIVLLDGLDTTAIAFVAPAMAREWGMATSAFTPAFVSTSVGAVIGYMVAGPLSIRFGLRVVGVGSTLLFGLGSLCTVAVTNLESLVILRLITAIGLGSVLPIMIALATNVMPNNLRQMIAMLVATGLAAGNVLGGLVGAPLMAKWGWESIFWVGGVLPLIFALPLLFVLPKFQSVEQRQQNSDSHVGKSVVRALFGPGLALPTFLLWSFAFLIFLNAYVLMFWVPTLLMEFGFRPEQAPLGTAALGLGGLVGNLFIIAFTAKVDVKVLLAGMLSLAVACILVVSQINVPQAWVLPLIGGLGAGLITSCVGQSVLAVLIYPTTLRATGIGWAAALGRIGSIVGPAIGGAMLTVGSSAKSVVLITILPTLLGLSILFIMKSMERKQRSV